MRGPGMRLGLDVRRSWRCPQCGAERKQPADVTSVRCSACSAAPFMQIVEPQRRPRPTPKPLNPFITIDLDTPEEGESRSAVATVIVTETVVEGAIVQESAAPTAPNQQGGPPQKRNDRRNKPRRQRDRQGKPDRPSQNSDSAPPADSSPAMNAPEPPTAPIRPPSDNPSPPEPAPGS